MQSILDMRADAILKEERVSYLKSKMALLPGKLYLTRNRLFLQAHKQTIHLGAIFRFFKKKVEEKDKGFSLDIKQIAKMTRGKYTRMETLEITDHENNHYRLLVPDIDGWEKAINQRR